jgi:hypothetical protein
MVPEPELTEAIRRRYPKEVERVERLHAIALENLRRTDLEKYETETRRFVWAQVARMVEAFRSACILFLSGSELDATAVTRTVVEIGIDLEYVLLNPDERIRKYIDFGLVLERRGQEALKAVYPDLDVEALAREGFEKDQLPRHETWEERKARTEAALTTIKSSQKSWTQVDLGKRAEEINVRTFVYDLVYAEGCKASHSGAGGNVHELATDCLPKMPDSPLIVELASGFLLAALATLAKTFGLDQESLSAIGREMRLVRETAGAKITSA